MSLRESKPKFVLIVLVLLLCLMCQEIAATGRLRSNEGCTSAGTACHVKVTGLHEALETKDYGQGDESPPHYDYDFYRKHGDIPSPGVGH